MLAILTLLIVLALCGAALAWFVHLERDGRPLVVLVFLTWLLVVESVLYYSPNEVLTGILHPELGGLSFRVFDILVPAAVVARLLAPGEHRVHPATLWWLPFVGWLVGAAVLGVLRGNNLAYLTFEAKLGVYLALIPLAAGIPARELLTSVAVRRLLVGSACLATLLMATATAGVAVALPVPLLPIEALGRFGSDLASIFAGMGIACLAVALCSERRRGGLLLVSAPLLLCPFAVGQRAALLALAVSLVAVALLLPLAWRRLRTTPSEMAVVAAVALAAVMVPVLAPALGESRSGSLPFEEPVRMAFTSREKQLSGDDRLNQWNKARSVIAQRPVFGWGLGATYVSWDPGFFRFRENFLTHNIVGDLLFRTGLVGALLFGLATLLAVGAGVRGWLLEPDRLVAALALGCTAAAAGILAKGLVESIFEKYRLAIFLAMLLGFAIAAGAKPPAPSRPPAR